MLDQGGKTIDWDDFRFVLAIVRGGSVSAAAKQLAVDHATVIRRVDRLEGHLSAKLFDRRKTGYLLTEAGQRVADSAEAMESTIVASQEAVGGSRAHLTGTVRIGAPDGFGSHFLASRLVKFTERYPDLDLQLVATARLFSLSKREADIAISLTMPKEGRIVGRKLLDYSLGLYAAPAYLDRAPTITDRSDLPAHRFVGYIEELLFTPELDLPAAGLAEDLRKVSQCQPDRAAQRHHRGIRHSRTAALHGDRSPRTAPGAAGRGEDIAHVLDADARRQQGPGAHSRGGRLHPRDGGKRAGSVWRAVKVTPSPSRRTPCERRDPYAAAVVGYGRYLTPVPDRKAAAYGSRLKAGTTWSEWSLVNSATPLPSSLPASLQPRVPARPRGLS